MVHKNIKILLVIANFFILINFIACSTFKHNFSAFDEDIRIPVGIDSLIIAHSDSISKYLFVDYRDEQKAFELFNVANLYYQKADSLWELLKVHPQKNYMHNDSCQVIQHDSVEFTIMNQKIKDNLKFACKKYKESVLLNPFQLKPKDGLAQTYILMAEVEKNKNYYSDAAEVLKDILLNERGEHLLYFKLGECYFHLEKWDDAYRNYHKAEELFYAVSFIEDIKFVQNVMSDSVEKELYFSYLYSQAVCLARLYRADEALSMIKSAKVAAHKNELKEIAIRFEQWLNWDNGNIHTAEIKNDILKLIKDKKYKAAVDQFENLKGKLSDREAKNEIEWRISGLEFKFLNKKEAACDRLMNVIESYESNKATQETLFKQYVNDCGAMHYHLGQEYLGHSRYKLAQKYFENGAKIEWGGNYRCKLELAKLLKHDPKGSLLIINEVLEYQENLTNNEHLDALKIKLNALKKLGSQYLPETQQTYHQIRTIQKMSDN